MKKRESVQGQNPWSSPGTLPRFHPNRGSRDLRNGIMPAVPRRATIGNKRAFARNGRSLRAGSSKKRLFIIEQARGPAAPCPGLAALCAGIKPSRKRETLAPPVFVDAAIAAAMPRSSLRNALHQAIELTTGSPPLVWKRLSARHLNRRGAIAEIPSTLKKLPRLLSRPRRTLDGQQLTGHANLRRVLRREIHPPYRKPPGRTSHAETLRY